MEYQRCARGLWDTTIPGIRFDEEGVSNFAKMQESLMAQYPRGAEGLKVWEGLVDEMKRAGKNRKYDCIIGISGGTDSCYLLHVAHEYGLRVLAYNLDNGWSSDIAVKNIKTMTNALNYDLETYVLNYEDVKIALKSYLLAGLPWVDSPTDLAIKAIFYKLAVRENIKYTLNGGDFRSEGKQPLLWTYSDAHQFKYLVKRFFNRRLKNYPKLTLTDWVYYGLIKKVKVIRPLYFLPYEKKLAKELLKEKYGWVDYGGHHHENIFTKFIMSYWLPVKFGIDKRIITMSAQILSGEIKRENAIQSIKITPFDPYNIEKDISYVIKKLDLKQSEFDTAFKGRNRYFNDYPSYYPMIKRFSKLGKMIAGKIFSFKPGIFESIDQGI